MTSRNTLFEEIMVKGLKSPVTQKLVFDLCLGLLPLILISLDRG